MKTIKCTGCQAVLKGPNSMDQREMLANHKCSKKRNWSDLDGDLMTCVILGDLTEPQAFRNQDIRNQRS